jgi:hypothetical protein
MLNKHPVDDSKPQHPELSFSQDARQTRQRHDLFFMPLFFVATMFAPRTDNNDDKKNGE